MSLYFWITFCIFVCVTYYENSFLNKPYLSSVFGNQNIENILLLRKGNMANILNENLYDSSKYMHKISRGVLYSDDDNILNNYKDYKNKDEKSKKENKNISGNKENHGNENNIIFEDGNPEISFFTNRENLKIARYTWKPKEEKTKAYVFALHGVTTHLRNQYLNYYGRPEWANKNEKTMKECSINESSKLRNSCSQSNNDISNKKKNNENNVNENVNSQNVTNKKDFTKSMDDNNVLLFTESDKDNDVYKNLYYCSKCGLSNYCNCGKRTMSYDSSWIQTLNDNGYTFCGIDNQSHGLSEASRNERCFVEDFENLVADAVQALEIFVNEWKAKNELRPIIIMGTSMGGCIALKMFEKIYDEKKEWRKYIKGLALISPMISLEKQTSTLFVKMLIGLGYILKNFFPLYKFKVLGKTLKYPWIKLDDDTDPYHYHEELKAGIALECLFGTYSCMKSKIIKYIDESDIDIIVLQSKYDNIVDPSGTVNFVNKMVNVYNKKDEEDNSNISQTIKSGGDKNLISNQSNNLSNQTCKYEKDYVILSGKDLKNEDILWKPCDHGHYRNYKRKKNSTKSDKKNEKDKNNYKHLSAHILNYGSHKLSCEPDNKVTSSIFVDWLNNIFN
ncbi:putative alpha/beta hydrolase [Plasmodium gaboni]|uniref:Putative alpha/beta hydrolase n=1 Tax=Plasmodium gaboni TaxID=647221 RepID=A0A151L3S2_9APIC|nr:putative alpha/beta hydrolase [Plasmodium gaboni]KYN93605.1 putative alpha/beta hydrolase [Plasmodium gaboni]